MENEKMYMDLAKEILKELNSSTKKSTTRLDYFTDEQLKIFEQEGLSVERFDFGIPEIKFKLKK